MNWSTSYRRPCVALNPMAHLPKGQGSVGDAPKVHLSRKKISKIASLMLDQTFSAKNFMNVYSQENRMGRIPVETMGLGFQTVVEEMKIVNSELKKLKSLKKSEKTEDIKKQIDELKKKQKDLKENKQKVLFEELQGLSTNVNSHAFRFAPEKVWIGDKMGFKIDSKDHAQLFAMKQLQVNLQKTFKVKQANRHLIMTNIKLLLKTKRPFYIIRTDISSFFESIPQEQLKHIVMDNTLLSHKSKIFVNAILKEYEAEKAKLTEEERDGMKKSCGVPRGIGISSLLSEIYMRDLDSSIKKRPEVIFYVRYVDDIFILLAELPQGNDIEEYYSDLVEKFNENGLRLKSMDDIKCSLFNCFEHKDKTFEVSYLGYKLTITTKVSKSVLKYADVTYSMSVNKKGRITNRIDNAFKHFDVTNKYDIHQARKDLVDSLKLITGNVRLHKSKSGIKTGLYYNSDLLDDKNDLETLNTYLYSKKVNLHKNLFHTEDEKKAYLTVLYSRIRKFNFVTAWETRKMYDLKDSRMKEIMGWLNNEKEEDKTTL